MKLRGDIGHGRSSIMHIKLYESLTLSLGALSKRIASAMCAMFGKLNPREPNLPLRVVTVHAKRMKAALFERRRSCEPHPAGFHARTRPPAQFDFSRSLRSEPVLILARSQPLGLERGRL